MSAQPTLIFDCDGVLADTERHGHLPAFNQMFEDLGLPVRWSERDYEHKLAIGGGKERLTSLLTAELIAAAGLPSDRASRANEVARWHRHKTELYTRRVLAGELPPRPGVRRLIDEALAAGWRLAVASTSALESVQAVLQVAAGGPGASAFAGVFAGDMVARKKPAPDIYELALRRLEADPARTLVIEDSRAGLLAARGAGLRCLVTVSSYTAQQSFAEALLVVDHLGDPGVPLSVLENRSPARPAEYLRLEDLQRCLLGPAEAAAATGSGEAPQG